jgi:cell division protein FtsW (lipid II flippase)
MSEDRYLAFIPLLIYGLALANLFKQWKRFFDKDQFFLPYIAMTILLTEVCIYNVFDFFRVLDKLENDITFIQYWQFIIPSLIFLITIEVFTPDQSDKTKDYFDKRMRLVFILLVLFVSTHLIGVFQDLSATFYIRIILIVILILGAITTKYVYVYIIIGLRVVWYLQRFVLQGLVDI